MVGKISPVRGAALLSAAIAILASAMTPASAAAPAKKPAPSKTVRKNGLAKRLANTSGGGSGMLSLEWTISAMLQP